MTSKTEDVKGFKSKSVKLNTGWEIPLIGFGTYKIADQLLMDQVIDETLSTGYRHFDTAKLYNNENLLGSSLERFLPKYGLKREDIFIVTKFFPVVGEKARHEVSKLIEESLRNLRTCYLDLVLIHYPRPEENSNDDHNSNFLSRKENWLELEKIPKTTIHSIGVSNYEVLHLDEMAEYTSQIPAVNQLEYHPHFRRDLVRQFCKEKGIFFQAFSSLARQEPDLIGDSLVVELANKYRTTVQVILLSFATSQGVGVIPKSTNSERIRDNFKCLNITLSPEDIEKLNSIDKDKSYIRPTPWLVE